MKKKLKLGLLVLLAICLLNLMSVGAAPGVNDYPYATSDGGVDPWNFYKRQCTSFVAWRLNNDNGVPFTNQYLGAARWGDGKDWAAAARGCNVPVDDIPVRGSVACWLTGGQGHGHVAWVLEVKGDTIVIEEYNFNVKRGYGTRTLKKGTSSYPQYFIHIKDLNAQVKIDSDIPQLYVEQANTFLYSVTGEAKKSDVKWKSSAPDVLEVSSTGDIKGKKAGTATVTAYLTDSSGAVISEDQRTVTVTDPVLQYEKSTVTLKVEESKKPALKVTGIQGTISYKSSNPKVASVDSNGWVKGKTPGTAVITASWKKYSTKCTITVKSSLTISPTSVTLWKGEKASLKVYAKGLDGKAVWSTSNKKVATVNQKGKVTAKGKGTCTITVKQDGKTATCKVKVRVPKLTLNTKKCTLKAGETYKLKATVTGPSTRVEWKSSKPSVVSVKNGLLTAKNEGTATITAKANGISATCKVTVKPKLTLSPKSLTLNPKQTAKLTAVVKGSKKKVTWSSSNKSIAAVDKKGNVTAKKEGTCTIKAKLGKLSVSCSVTVKENQEYKKLYSDFLKTKEYSSASGERIRSFGLYHLNADAIPELVVEKNMWTVDVYTVSNHKVVYCGDVSAKGGIQYDRAHKAVWRSWWTNGIAGSGAMLLRVNGTKLQQYKYNFSYEDNGKRIYKIGDGEGTEHIVSTSAYSSFFKKWFDVDREYFQSVSNTDSVRRSTFK